MSTKKNNTINIPEARAAMDKFKMEAASDRGVFSPQKITNTDLKNIDRNRSFTHPPRSSPQHSTGRARPPRPRLPYAHFCGGK